VLTPNDVHYLVGLLTLASEPDGVDIELGSNVPDTASEEERDVDITVTARNADKTIHGIGGWEVKAHSRPLDSTHVEQLAAKLNDMPSLSRRSIVSASGYFGPAQKKAEKHGIDLLELKDWDYRKETFDHFQASDIPLQVRGLEWVGNVNAQIDPHNRIPKEDHAVLQANPPVWQNETTLAASPDLNTFINNLKRQALQQLMTKWEPVVIDPTEVKRAHVVVNITDGVFVKAGNRRHVLSEVVFDGQVRWRQEQRQTVYKVLQRVGDARPLAGCCVFDIPEMGLGGLMVSSTDRTVRFVHVPVAERLRKKIFRRPITQRKLPIEREQENGN
jgi:hypothetical protein